MDRTKPLQEGVSEIAAGRSGPSSRHDPDQIRDKNLFAGLLPLPCQPPRGGWSSQFEIQELIKQEQRDLTRFDLTSIFQNTFFRFPPPIYLTSRPDLGDISKES
jgi:hypothetical protein